MRKENIQHLPSFYVNYVNNADDLLLIDALEASLQRLRDIDLDVWEQLDQQTYFPGKWTLNELIQHLIDCERVFSYRAMAFARAETLALPGFDEDAYAAQSFANERSIEDLLLELKLLRQLTILQFKAFSPEILLRSGNANNNVIDVLALGFVIVGHEMHHMKVVESHYLSLLNHK